MLETILAGGPEAAAAVEAAWDAGRAVAVLDPRWPADELDRARRALRLADPLAGEVAAVVLTSGTEGEPKAVELTWDGMRASAQAVSQALAVDPASDRWLCLLPLHHVAGLAIVARSWVTGTPLVFDAGDARSTLVSVVPTQARRTGLERFRRVLVGGGPVPESISSLSNVVTTYGLTETWGGVVHDGHPLAGVEVRLDGPAGEILLRTPTAMRGYRGLPPVAPGDWLRTGDVGCLDASGRLHVVDRLKDLIVTGGVNVSPAEVERALAAHPGVADVAVAGLPDPEWGERVVAYVVPTGRGHPPELDDLREFARERLAPPKLPKELVLVAAVPRTPAGKVLRRHLRSSPQGGSTRARRP